MRRSTRPPERAARPSCRARYGSVNRSCWSANSSRQGGYHSSVSGRQAERKSYTSSVVQPKSRSFITSSVGTKILLGSTGLLLVTYLIIHIVGNLVFLLGPTAFNSYANTLSSLPIVIPIE